MLISEAKTLTAALPAIQADLSRGLGAKQGNALIALHEKNIEAANAAETARALAVRTKDASATGIRAFMTRVRSSARGAFGADSDQYESVGGTRTSDIKKRTRKPKSGGPTVTK